MDIEIIDQQDSRLGRQKVHDERSRAFPMQVAIDKSAWKSKTIRIYDPTPNPQQPVGCCTGVAKASQLNAVGNRVSGKVLGLPVALDVYRGASRLDPWPGEWEPTDTGSSGLASCKAAQQLGLGGEYRWFFGGADEVVQAIMEGKVVSVGTWWYEGMFDRDANGVVKPIGHKVGGHQYVVRGYNKSKDLVLCRNWWGPEFKDFWISRSDLNDLLLDDGDAHWQVRLDAAKAA